LYNSLLEIIISATSIKIEIIFSKFTSIFSKLYQLNLHEYQNKIIRINLEFKDLTLKVLIKIGD